MVLFYMWIPDIWNKNITKT